MSSIPQEAVKEVLFGGLCGLVTGYAVKKLSIPALAGVASISFIYLRAAIFDARVLAPWSPLKIDDASFASDLKRKARREALSNDKRLEMFFKENFYIFASYSGGLMISNAL